ncbi:MAG: DUF4097 family beta strand repeat-containing protein [Clostridium sp.]|nr:DUF4097 family beta strand repeat-containing protein [Clostridium sp.]
MKKIGTITFSIGLVYYGIWLALKNFNSNIANLFFKLWPIIFIILGVEIFILRNKWDLEGEKYRFNVGAIIIICIFAVTNVFLQVTSLFNNSNFEITDFSTKNVEVNKTFDLKNKNISFETNNGDVTIKKSDDDTVKFEGTARVSRSYNKNSYDIKNVFTNDYNDINMEDGSIRNVKGTLYIPDGVNLKLYIKNVNFNSCENISGLNIDLESDNGNVNIIGASTANLKLKNGYVNLTNVENVKMNSNNIKAYLNGKFTKIDTDFNNGLVQMDNVTFKNINITGNKGSVILNTKEGNIKANLSCSLGNAKFNDENISNGNLVKETGDKSNSMNISIKVGSIDVNSQE